jgi:hypothetical protein
VCRRRRRLWAIIGPSEGSCTERQEMDISHSLRVELDRARPALLQLMRNHRPGGGTSEALADLADAYLRLNPDDAEVMSVRDGLITRDGNA